MNQVPHPASKPREREILHWMACERDAAYAAKLAILRLVRKDDIAQVGVWLGDHERHADELGALLPGGGRAPREPAFVTRDPHVIGALSDPDDVLAAMARLEAARIVRYDSSPRRAGDLRVALDRHLRAAHARLAWLNDRRRARVGRLEPLRLLHVTTPTTAR